MRKFCLLIGRNPTAVSPPVPRRSPDGVNCTERAARFGAGEGNRTLLAGLGILGVGKHIRNRYNYLLRFEPLTLTRHTHPPDGWSPSASPIRQKNSASHSIATRQPPLRPDIANIKRGSACCHAVGTSQGKPNMRSQRQQPGKSRIPKSRTR